MNGSVWTTYDRSIDRDVSESTSPAVSSRTVRVLHLDDAPADSERIVAALEASGIRVVYQRVDSRDAFARSVGAGDVDVVLGDPALPAFDGASALRLTRELAPDLPFLFLSDPLGEEAAVDVLRLGADDYVLKSRLTELPGAVLRALDRAEERRRLRETQARLLQAQTLEAVARLAGGVAHDFNNLLTTITGYAQMLETARAVDPALGTYLDEIRTAADRAAVLTRQLLAFSRQEVAQPVVLSVADVIVGMERALLRAVGDEVDLAIDVAACVPAVRIDRNQLEQVVMSLVVNARDATPRGGSIRVSTSEVSAGRPPFAADRQAEPSSWVVVSVSDTGSGMLPETKARVFEPFFTTKARGKGSGLGLAAAHGIVTQAGGRIDVHTAPGSGSTFDVHLPAASGAPQELPGSSTAQPAIGGRERILVAEDSGPVRALLTRVLSSRGYEVIAAEDGVDAIERLDGETSPIDLLVSDIVMPRMGGPHLADEVMRRLPACRVLFVSGYADEESARRVDLRTGRSLLRKPFTPTALLQSVRALLDGPAP